MSLSIVVGMIAGFIAWSVVPPRYEAQALFHIAHKQPRIIFATDETYGDLRTYQQTQIALIRSRSVLNAALREIADLPIVREQEDPVDWLAREIQAEFDGEIFRIGMSDTKPDGLAEVINAVQLAYLDEGVNQEGRQHLERYKMLQEIYSQYQDRLEAKRKELRTLEKEIGATDDDPDTFRREIAFERRRISERALARLGIERSKTRAELDVRSAALEGEDPDQPDQDAEKLAELRTQLRILDAQAALIESELEAFDAEHRSLVKSTWTLERVRDEIAKMEEAAGKIGSEVEELNVELKAPPRVRLIERAEAPLRDQTRRKQAAAMAGGIGAAVVLVAGLLASFRRPGRDLRDSSPDHES